MLPRVEADARAGRTWAARNTLRILVGEMAHESIPRRLGWSFRECELVHAAAKIVREYPEGDWASPESLTSAAYLVVAAALLRRVSKATSGSPFNDSGHRLLQYVRSTYQDALRNFYASRASLVMPETVVPTSDDAPPPVAPAPGDACWVGPPIGPFEKELPSRSENHETTTGADAVLEVPGTDIWSTALEEDRDASVSRWGDTSAEF